MEDDEDEFLFDEITGARNKKPVMAILNKNKLTKYELDELMNAEVDNDKHVKNNIGD